MFTFNSIQKMTAIEHDGKHAKVTYEFEPFDKNDDERNKFTTSCFNCVHGTKLSKWTFTSLDDGKKTRIELEVATDPKITTFSSFFVNV